MRTVWMVVAVSLLSIANISFVIVIWQLLPALFLVVPIKLKNSYLFHIKTHFCCSFNLSHFSPFDRSNARPFNMHCECAYAYHLNFKQFFLCSCFAQSYKNHILVIYSGGISYFIKTLNAHADAWDFLCIFRV